jgi:hypothetical protein
MSPHTGMMRWKAINPDARLMMSWWTNSTSCPSLWPPVVSQMSKKAATRPMTFWPRRSDEKKNEVEQPSSPAAIATPTSLHQRGPPYPGGRDGTHWPC